MTDTHARGRVRVEPSNKRVRAFVGGEVVVDTTHPLLVWENPNYPAYYLPRADVSAALIPTGTTVHSPSRGDTVHYTVKAGGKELVDAAWQYPDSPLEELRDHVRFEWNALDAWFEEDEEVYVHPRSPYARVDILPSSRHLRVLIDGVVVAETHRPWLLFETGLPTRYYIPKVDVRMDLLEPTDSHTACPYKGTASYWSATVNGQRHDDVVWSYPTPLLESHRIAGLVAFYNDRVTIEVDGEVASR
jgi:uncharacterized protein (DUF427 family)